MEVKFLFDTRSHDSPIAFRVAPGGLRPPLSGLFQNSTYSVLCCSADMMLLCREINVVLHHVFNA